MDAHAPVQHPVGLGCLNAQPTLMHHHHYFLLSQLQGLGTGPPVCLAALGATDHTVP
jgi:hypothetical protein